jgi:two-component system sensor histidine kinase UhpB
MPLLAKLLAVNGLVIVAGATLGTASVKALTDISAFTLAALLAVGGVALSLALNYIVLKMALRPLTDLTDTVGRVQDGHTPIRAPSFRDQDPDIGRLTNALNTMLDRLASHTATIEVHREQLRALSAKVTTAQEEERKRIARELHDETSQALASLLIALERIDAAIPPDLSDLKVRLTSARQLTVQTLGGLRTLIADLRPLLLDDLGLVPAIRWFATERLESQGIDVEFRVGDGIPRLPPPVETALFRVAQEAITNIVKHAEASQVKIELTSGKDLTLTVEDDGVGLDLEGPMDYDGLHHLGLFGIHERAVAMGGTSAFTSIRGQGSRVRVSIPFEALGVGHDRKDTRTSRG